VTDARGRPVSVVRVVLMTLGVLAVAPAYWFFGVIGALMAMLFIALAAIADS